MPSLNHVFLAIVLLLLGSSMTFTAGVVAFKRRLASGTATSLKSGQEVPVLQVIDGDELSVQAPGGSIRVRLLGIYAYDPTASDPAVQPAARQALLHLEERLNRKSARLVFEEFKVDPHKRLLSYLHVEDRDLGLEMVEKGLVLAYTKYPFSRMADYTAAEERAREARLGLWADAALVQRSRQLRVFWDAERARGD